MPAVKNIAAEIQKELKGLSSPADAAFLQGYFKTGPGQYGEGDIFRGIRVPVLRRLAVKHRHIPLEEADALLHSPYHEDRLFALLILVDRYGAADEAGRAAVYRLYLDRTDRINNWDLVDLSAPRIVGAHLSNRSRKPLYTLARSKNLWERRIAVLATFYFIRNSDFEDSLKIAALLLGDKEDLIRKAAGWMLREVGKRDLKAAEDFLLKHCRRMPRTMLRYAIERFPEETRRRYLKGEI
jgi:3-methyladenine DNA glycosylase AlkD